MNKKLKNYKHELFCNLYASNRECMGNATRAYMIAYGLKDDNYRSANRNAHRLMINEGIIKRTQQILNEFISEKVADRELFFVILQRADLRAKVAAICEYNKTRGHINKKLGGNFIFSWEKEDHSLEA